MYQSSLPDEVNSSRPKGMLDRDLRTTLTVWDDVNHRNSELSSTSDQYENCRNKRNNMGGTKINHSDGYTYKCKYDKQLKDDDGSLWKGRRLSIKRLDRKYPSSRGFYRSLKRAKFGHCLLVFLCIWLATIHRTCAYPAMSDQTDQHHNAIRCKAIKDALIKPIEQTQLTYQYIRGLLENYTQAQFKKQPSELHAIWRHKQPHFVYNEKFVSNVKDLLTDDYEGEPDESQIKHISVNGIPTNDELTSEFQRIYVFLYTIKKVLDQILEDRRINATKILHDLNNDRRAHENINELFTEQSKYNEFEIREISAAMTALQIPRPQELEEITIQNLNREPNIGEWLATRENLKVLRYMRGVYKTFKDRCHP